MAIARAKAFQERQQEQQDNMETLFQLKIVKPGDAGLNLIIKSIFHLKF